MEPVGNSSGKWKVVRAFPRFAIELDFTLQPSVAEFPSRIPGRMVDIGLGGFGGVLATDVNLRQRLVAEFSLPDSADPVQVKVIVRYHKESRYGFEFLDISPRQRDLIRQACQGLEII
jgi:c-di-GMP-binding flagellar brake protein YcgR